MGATASLQSGDLAALAEENDCGDALHKLQGLDKVRVAVHLADDGVDELASEEHVREEMRAVLREVADEIG